MRVYTDHWSHCGDNECLCASLRTHGGHLIDFLIGHLIDWSLGRSFGLFVGQSPPCSVFVLVSTVHPWWLVDHSVSLLVSLLVGHAIGPWWSLDQSFSRSVRCHHGGHLINLLIGHLIDRSLGRSFGLFVGQSPPWSVWSMVVTWLVFVSVGTVSWTVSRLASRSVSNSVGLSVGPLMGCSIWLWCFSTVRLWYFGTGLLFDLWIGLLISLTLEWSLGSEVCIFPSKWHHACWNDMKIVFLHEPQERWHCFQLWHSFICPAEKDSAALVWVRQGHGCGSVVCVRVKMAPCLSKQHKNCFLAWTMTATTILPTYRLFYLLYSKWIGSASMGKTRSWWWICGTCPPQNGTMLVETTWKLFSCMNHDSYNHTSNLQTLLFNLRQWVRQP